MLLAITSKDFHTSPLYQFYFELWRWWECKYSQLRVSLAAQVKKLSKRGWF